MPVGFLFEVPGMTQQQYDEIMRQMGLHAKDARWPEGLLSHVAGPMEGGWRVTDVWQSPEEAEAFFRSRLAAAAQAAGVSPPQPRVFPVHSIYTSAS